MIKKGLSAANLDMAVYHPYPGDGTRSNQVFVKMLRNFIMGLER